MKTLQEKYNGVLKEQFSKTQFKRDAILEFPNIVTTHNTFDDVVKILKSKGHITEEMMDRTLSYQEAVDKAKSISKAEQVVQHVNKVSNGNYEVSDWYDADTTEASFEGGRELFEDLGENFKQTSSLEKIIQQAWAMRDLNQAKQFVSDYISKSKINDHSKKKILYTLETIKNKTKLDFYLANSLLSYEKLGLSHSVDEDTREGRYEFEGEFYEIWYSPPKGYVAKGIGPVKNMIAKRYFNSEDDAKEHAELELRGGLGLDETSLDEENLTQKIAVLELPAAVKNAVSKAYGAWKKGMKSDQEIAKNFGDDVAMILFGSILPPSAVAEDEKYKKDKEAEIEKKYARRNQDLAKHAEIDKKRAAARPQQKSTLSRADYKKIKALEAQKQQILDDMDLEAGIVQARGDEFGDDQANEWGEKLNRIDALIDKIRNKGRVQENVEKYKEEKVNKHEPELKEEDKYSFEDVRRGLVFELEKMGIDTTQTTPSKEQFETAKAKALKELSKNRLHYLNLLAGENDNTDKHDQMIPISGNNFVDKYNGMQKLKIKEAVKKIVKKAFPFEIEQLVSEDINEVRRKQKMWEVGRAYPGFGRATKVEGDRQKVSVTFHNDTVQEFELNEEGLWERCKDNVDEDNAVASIGAGASSGLSELLKLLKKAAKSQGLQKVKDILQAMADGAGAALSKEGEQPVKERKDTKHDPKWFDFGKKIFQNFVERELGYNKKPQDLYNMADHIVENIKHGIDEGLSSFSTDIAPGVFSAPDEMEEAYIDNKTGKVMYNQGGEYKPTQTSDADPDLPMYKGKKIVVKHIKPPIPVRNYDYEATFDDYDEGDPMGYGPTAAAAKKDLLIQARDRQ